MTLDLTFEYDCCPEEYIGHTVLTIIENGIWVTYHTDKGNEYLKRFNITLGKPHKRIKIPFDKAYEIYKRASPEISKSYGGFYWRDIEHTKHN